jgi:hypothetical protein
MRSNEFQEILDFLARFVIDRGLEGMMEGRGENSTKFHLHIPSSFPPVLSFYGRPDHTLYVF